MLQIEPFADRDPRNVLAELLDRHQEFWGERDLRAAHAWPWFHQFGRWGLLAVDADRIVGYLFGTVTADGLGYVQLIAVLPAYRRTGLATALWRRFAQSAQQAGATRLEAITGTANTGSVAFHTGLGMTAEEVPDYAGPGQSRILFRAPVEAIAAG
jgi:ribosomal protein S18 acetylase RimI-like enzyme